jgi:5-formyltetrahydrofolate cyclo-ligase
MSNKFSDSNSQNLIRLKSRRRRKQLGRLKRERASAIIADKITSANFFQRVSHIGCYLSIGDEVDTSAIISRAWRMKKRIFVPLITNSNKMKFRELSANCDARPNRFGIMEPSTGEFISPRQLDIVLTPGAAFDATGNRIGMGGGYFDRTFSFLANRQHFLRPKLIGLAFDCQVVEKIPANPWDIRVFCTITEGGHTNAKD